MTKIIIQDNILTNDEAYKAHEFFFVVHKGNNLNNWISKEDWEKLTFIKKITETASSYFDLSSCAGYEWWIHSEGSLPPRGWHKDLDEKHWADHYELKYPLCSIIYYPLIQDLQGGHFLTEDVKIAPKTNRTIFMESEQWHNVEPYQNGRWSILINPWSYKLDWAQETFKR